MVRQGALDEHVGLALLPLAETNSVVTAPAG
jgi:hypothetical protein